MADVLALVACVALQSSTWVGTLGLYGDDWDFAARLRNADAATFTGLWSALWDDVTYLRPVQILGLVVLHQAFGESWAAYHATAAACFGIVVVLLYCVAIAVHGSRAAALALALVYAHLPHFASARLWIAALQAPVALALLLSSLRADLAAPAAPTRSARVVLDGCGLMALAASVLAYEVFMPLFLASPVLVAMRCRRLEGRRPWAHAWWLCARNGVALALLGCAKLLLTSRVTPMGAGEQMAWFAWLLRRAVRVALLHEHGAGAWEAARQVLRSDLIGETSRLVTLAGVLLTVVCLMVAQRRPVDCGVPEWRLSMATVLCGCAVFFAGYAVFGIVGNAFITASGQANRIAIAAGLGVALVLVGVLGLVARLLGRSTFGRVVFAGGGGFIVALGSLLLQAQAASWGEARVRQDDVVRRLTQRVPTLPPHATLLLDGFCPYVGPAPVFDGILDASGLMQFLYRDPSLTGDVVTPKLSVGDEGVATRMFARRFVHGYAELFVFQVDTGRLFVLPDRAAAETYFRDASPNRAGRCPFGSEGRGVPIFHR